jgi:hypothetical protein
MRRWGRFFLLFLLVDLGAVAVRAQTPLWSGIINAPRATNWQNAGVTGGIPDATWTQCGSTIAAYGSSGSPASPAAINNAISACGPNTYVQLGAGTFYLNGGLLVNGQNNVAIRGMGANSTFLIFSGNNSCQGAYSTVCFQSPDVNWNGGPSNGPVNWTASSYAQGATSISLASVPNLKVGNPIILDQLDDTTDIGSLLENASTTPGSFTSPGSPGPYSLQGDNGEANRPGRGQLQIVTVTQCDGNSTPGHSCSSGNNITISPGLIMPQWSASKAPQAWWASGPIENVGVENLSINATNAGFGAGWGSGVEFFNVLNGWVKGVETIATSRAAVQSYYSARITVRDSYFFLASNSTSTSYGFECYASSDDLVENNIFQAIAGPLTINGSCEGVVLGYNFAIMQYYTSSAGWMMPMSNSHGINTDYDLYEGNIGSQVNGDVFHGSHNMDTLFRNYFIGNLPACTTSPFGTPYLSAVFGACTSNQVPIYLLSFSRFFNIIGNVLGQPGIQTGYASGSPPIYALGPGDAGDIPGTSTFVTVPSDPQVAATLFRWGNWDVVSNATRWCGTSSDAGWATTCGGTSEVPTSNPFYPNAIPTKGDTAAGQAALPPSFYYSSQPSWWPSSKPWPSIGPDVSGGNISGTGGHANTNPAEDCFLTVMGGAPSGTNLTPLSFNANTCYGSGSTTTQVPQPPSNLSATVQ